MTRVKSIQEKPAIRAPVRASRDPFGFWSFCGPNERGDVIVLFAICALAIVLLAISLSVEVPTHQSNATKSLHAETVGVATGIFSPTAPADAAQHAYDTAVAIMGNYYELGKTGIYSSGLEESNVWIPAYAPGNDPPDFDDYIIYDCSSGTCGKIPARPSYRPNEQLLIAQRAFDPTYEGVHINDFYNGVLFHSRSRPLRYFGMIPEKTQHPAAAARLKPVMTYVLVDTAFSMDPANFDRMFGAAPRDPNQWAVAINREDFPPRPGWTYPADLGALAGDPYGQGKQTAREAQEFFASYCYNLPWDYYRGAAVDLIDWLAHSSAYSYTTIVGLAGPKHHRVIPIHPAVVRQGVSQLDISFPQTRALFEPQASAFNGYFRSDDARDNANNGVGSQYNLWHLCLCRGVANEVNAGNSPFTLTDYRLPAESEFSQADESIRERSNVPPHWCDDAFGGSADAQVDLGYGQSGSTPTAPNESIRNILAFQGPAFHNLGAVVHSVYQNAVDRLNDVAKGLPPRIWRRPASLESSDRYLPDSISQACTNLAAARSQYDADPVYGTKRPLDKSALIVYGFGLYSQQALLAEGKTPAEVSNDLTKALKLCACNLKIEVTLAFLPLTDFDRDTLILAANVIKEFQSQHNDQCAGAAPHIAGCSHTETINFLVADYQSADYMNNHTLSLPADESQIKINAAKAFRDDIIRLIRTFMIRYVYPI